MVDFESSKEQIAKLVEEFKANEKYYKSVKFDEENTKINFINKFFIALGWDVYNDQGFAPLYKDVEFEDTVIVNGKPKSPDYSFRIGGKVKFFVEAKAPHVNVENDRRYAFQLKRYTWSKKLPVGLLTDFQELSIYIPKSTPKKTQDSRIDRIKYYKYTDYVENWEEIYNIYSKEAVLSGKFDNYFSPDGLDGQNPTSTVDTEFLKTIEDWRLILARNMALRNKELSEDEVNFAVQLTIDRIIFLRIAEDRGIETYGRLRNLLDLSNDDKDDYPVYNGFIQLCKKADDKYNSGLFHFTEEKDINLDSDTLTPNLHVDDGVLKKIIKGLYYPDSPYEFSMISTEILGNIYEQFLGKVIRLTENHRAIIDDKPEVKKAGGVYYTPQYIVDYIVENTVGELLKGKTPNKVSELRIVDPACGSGSFLLGAYQKLLDWHVDYYSNLDQPPKNVIYTDKKGIVRLTIQEKKRILKNNIYGVDIDSQAVEVTKLSLLLKVLEDENKDLLEAQQKLIQERALPYLGDNIRCGNSLIGTDILEQEDLTTEEISKMNPFDWEDEFSEIFENGGFDAVIGNPPYVGEKGNKENFRYIKKTEWGKQYYYTKMDLFYFFYHKSLDICKDDGLISFITTNYFLTADGAIHLRNDFKSRASIIKVINFNELQVFKNAKGQHNIIFILEKSNIKKNKGEIINIKLKGELNSNMFSKILEKRYENAIFTKISQDDFFKGESNLIFLEGHGDSTDVNSTTNLINNILTKMKDGIKLKEILEINSGADITISKITKKHVDAYGSKFIKGEGVFVLTDEEFENMNIPQDELSIIKPFIKNSDILRYNIKTPTKKLIYTNSDTKINKYPTIKNHLIKFKRIFTDQMERYDEKYPWFMIHRPREERIFLNEKIILPYRSIDNKFAYSDSPIYASRDVFFLLLKNEDFDIKFLLALLNSKIYYIWLYYRGKRKGETLELYATPVGNIPIPNVPLEEQKPFIDLANKMIELSKQLQITKTPKEKRLLEKQIEVTDKKINQLVYELYDLTDEEIEIVESSLN